MARIESVFGAPPKDLRQIHRSWSAIWRAGLADGREIAVKTGDTARIEARMLTLLGEKGALPVPTIHHVDDMTLLMDWVPGGPPLALGAQLTAADQLARTHAVTADAFGLDFDTTIGPLPQPNPWTADWVAFFRDHRLLAQARLAADEGRISQDDLTRYGRLADKLPDLLEPPAAPALIHGDLWSGNILADGDRVTAVIDPAVYFGHFEIELAFTTLFDSFGPEFYAAYGEHRGLDAAWREGFLTLRRDLYNLYPLLVHTRLFGGGYGDRAAAIAARHVG